MQTIRDDIVYNSDMYKVEKWPHPYAPNAAMLRLVLNNEGYIVYQWMDQPGAFYGSHKHETDQSHWVVSGCIEITVNGITSQLTAGDRDLMPAETIHTARVIGNEPVLYLIGEMPPAKPSRKRTTKKKRPAE